MCPMKDDNRQGQEQDQEQWAREQECSLCFNIIVINDYKYVFCVDEDFDLQKDRFLECLDEAIYSSKLDESIASYSNYLNKVKETKTLDEILSVIQNMESSDDTNDNFFCLPYKEETEMFSSEEEQEKVYENLIENPLVSVLF